MLEYRVLSIIRGTTVDGPGFRTSIYLAGCAHACPGCHNPQSWNPEGGDIMTLSEIMDIVRDEDFDVTLSGGDPLFNPEPVRNLIEALKHDGRNVWIFTGFRWEEIMASEKLKDAVELADVVVDGPFVESLRNPDLLFRGSSNQRLIDVGRSISSGHPVTWRD